MTLCAYKPQWKILASSEMELKLPYLVNSDTNGLPGIANLLTELISIYMKKQFIERLKLQIIYMQAFLLQYNTECQLLNC